MTFVLRRNVSGFDESDECVFVSQGVLCKPLLLAARGGHKEIVEFLLEKGASPTEEDTVKLKHHYLTKKSVLRLVQIARKLLKTTETYWLLKGVPKIYKPMQTPLEEFRRYHDPEIYRRLHGKKNVRCL